MQLLVAWTYFSSALIKLRVAGWKYLKRGQPAALAIFHSLDNLHDTSFRLAFGLPEVKAYLPLRLRWFLLWELLSLSRSFGVAFAGGSWVLESSFISRPCS